MIFDRLLAAFALVCLSPLLLVVAIAIKLQDSGPVFYRQLRAGKDFKPFYVLKFRSMRVSSGNESPITANNDTRVTVVGRFLRKNKLDELPQLINVLFGEMRFVGARPEVPRFVEMFRDQYEAILRYHPGITDPASLAFRDEEKLLPAKDAEAFYIREILPTKLRISKEYSEIRTFFSDFTILWMTVTALLGLRKVSKNETPIDY